MTASPAHLQHDIEYLRSRVAALEEENARLKETIKEMKKKEGGE